MCRDFLLLIPADKCLVYFVAIKQIGTSHYQDMFESRSYILTLSGLFRSTIRLRSRVSKPFITISLPFAICVTQCSDQMSLLVLVQSTDVSIVNASNTFLELTGWTREFLGKQVKAEYANTHARTLAQT